MDKIKNVLVAVLICFTLLVHGQENEILVLDSLSLELDIDSFKLQLSKEDSIALKIDNLFLSKDFNRLGLYIDSIAKKDKYFKALFAMHVIDSLSSDFRLSLIKLLSDNYKLIYNNIKNPEYSIELRKIEYVDQMLRTGSNPLNYSMNYVDSINRIKLKHLFEKYGVPSKGEVDSTAFKAIFYVIQHGEPDYLKKNKELIEHLYKTECISSDDYACFKDRIMVYEKGVQMYGTQYMLDPIDSSFKLVPLLYPDKVDEIRKSIGLEPLMIIGPLIKVE